jgi:hypothetical protein
MGSYNRWIGIVLISLVLVLITACAGIEGEAVMQVWIDNPLSGSYYAGGGEVNLYAHARDVDGPGISEISFYANGELLASGQMDASSELPQAAYTWHPKNGNYEIIAVARNTGGAEVESDPIYIQVEGEQEPTTEQITEDVATEIVSTPTFTMTPSFTPTETKTGTFTPTPTKTGTPPPATVSFYSEDSSVNAGNCTDLVWQTTNTYAVELDGMSVSNNYGTWEVCPQGTTTYTLEATHAGGTITRNVTVDVVYNFPAQRFSDYVTLTITGGHGGIHHIGDSIQFCYSFGDGDGSFEIYDYSPASIGADGATGPYYILGDGLLYEAQNVCKEYTLVEPGGYEAFQFRIYKYFESPTPTLVDIAEVWFYTWP